MNWERFFNGLISWDALEHAGIALGVVLLIGLPLRAMHVAAADIWIAVLIVAILTVREFVQGQYKAGGPREWAAAWSQTNWGEAAAAAPGAAIGVLVSRMVLGW